MALILPENTLKTADSVWKCLVLSVVLKPKNQETFIGSGWIKAPLPQASLAEGIGLGRDKWRESKALHWVALIIGQSNVFVVAGARKILTDWLLLPQTIIYKLLMHSCSSQRLVSRRSQTSISIPSESQELEMPKESLRAINKNESYWSEALE